MTPSAVVAARAAAAAAVVVLLATACGSDVAEPDPPAEPGGPAPAASAAAPTPGGDGGPSSAGDPAGPAPAEVPAAAPPAPQASPQPAAEPQPPLEHLDTSGMRTFPGPEVWEALRQCQSQGDYGFVHPSGEYFGAYQFTVATWDRLANQRYTDLLGILPSEAAPADQDRMAYYLWIESGHARWPACGHVFTGDSPSGDPAAAGSDPAPAAGAAASDEGIVPGDPFEPAPGDDQTSEPGETGTTTTSPADLPSLEIDPSVQPAVTPDVAGFPTPEQWERLRFCEASGNYRAVSPDGRYYGAYQFWPDTWDFVARRNYPRLVGMLPSAATTHDQDRMAYRLWEERGDQPWPVCGRYLRPGS